MTNSLLLLVCLVAADTSTNVLERVPQLQETARRANGGMLGCGSGTLTIVTSRGEKTLETGLDPIQVFGKRIDSTDLLALLQARADSNRSWLGGPMSGDVSDLCFVCLHTLADAQETAAIPVMAELTEDGDETIRDWAELGLTKLEKTEPRLRQTIQATVATSQSAALVRRIRDRSLMALVLFVAAGVAVVTIRKRRRRNTAA